MAGMDRDGNMLEHRQSSDTADHLDMEDNLSEVLDPLDKQSHLKPQLSVLEKRNLLFLCAIYTIHAIPLQFSWSTMPIILRQQLGYSEVGTFLVSQYPYSWKALWSPLIDGFHITWLGRRKTWIAPSLLAGGAVLLWLAFAQDHLVAEIAAGSSFSMAWIVVAWFLVMIFCSNIRIALDSWAIDLLAPPNVHWASPIVTVGETVASLLSFNVFLGATSISAKKDEAGKAEPASTWFFYTASATSFVITAVLLLLGKRETSEGRRTQVVGEAYRVIWRILQLRHVWILMTIHMVSMIGFITNDTITVLQLVKNNFDDFQLAALATATLPFAIGGGYMVVKAFQTRHPLDVWRQMFPWRLLVAFLSQITVLFVSGYPDSYFRWLVVFLPFSLSRFFEAAMWVAFVAFHAQVSDPQYGGIYMSLLSTTLNIRYDTLQFLFTKTIGYIDGTEDLTKPSPLIDGYQIVNLAAVVLAVFLYGFFLRPATIHLQNLEVSAWRVNDKDMAEPVAYELVRTGEDQSHEA